MTRGNPAAGRERSGATNAPYCRAVPLALPPEEPDLALVYAAWAHERGEAGIPDRAAIRPDQLRNVLGRVNLVERAADGQSFRYRLAGTVIASKARYELTGKTTECIVPRCYREVVEEHYAEAFRLGAPTFNELALSNGTIERRYRRIILPYRTDDQAPGLLLTCTHYLDRLEDVIQSPAFYVEPDGTTPKTVRAIVKATL